MDYTKNKVEDFVNQNQGMIVKFIFNDAMKNQFDVEQEFIFKKLFFILFPFLYKQKKNE